MNGKEIVSSKQFKVFSAVIGISIIALVSFAGGVAVGLHKARFSYAWGENYERNFIGNRGNMMGDVRNVRRENEQGWGMMNRFGFDGRNFRNAHGIAGTVLSISDTNIIINDRDNKESTVAVTEKTLFKRNGEDIKISDIMKDDAIVVIGQPGDNGVVNADFIRVFKQGNNQ